MDSPFVRLALLIGLVEVGTYGMLKDAEKRREQHSDMSKLAL